MTMLEHDERIGPPAHWPPGLRPGVLSALALETPYLAVDRTSISDAVDRFRQALPEVRPFYAVKCNSLPEVLGTLAGLGTGFEIASAGELDLLTAVGVDPREVLYSNTVKPAGHIERTADQGVWRFAVDSEGEVQKVARVAPGSAVYVRVRVDDSSSVFPLSRKFGAEAHHARALLMYAESLGLVPYGITFHVGSQCVSTTAWVQAVACAARLMRQLAADGIPLEMLDIGGGFPARYDAQVPSIEQIGSVVGQALEDLLPYRPALLVAEPGRHLVAESAVMVASVLGREERAGEEWLYLDVGAYHGLMETLQTVGQWRFPLWTSRGDHSVVAHTPYTITGPTCDSSDTMFVGASLPVTMAEGDKVFIGSAGAYTLSYASSFNGFAPPSAHVLG